MTKCSSCKRKLLHGRRICLTCAKSAARNVASPPTMNKKLWVKYLGTFGVFLLAACTPPVPVANAPTPIGDEGEQKSDLVFEVDNRGIQDARIYLLRMGVPYRMGMATGVSTTRIRLRPSDLDGSGCIQIGVRLFPSDEHWMSERVCMMRGQKLTLWVNTPLTTSSLWPRK